LKTFILPITLFNDDANARRFAESNELRFTSSIGLLVAAVKTKRLKKRKERSFKFVDRIDRGRIRICGEYIQNP